MPKSLFARLLLHSGVVIVVLLVAAGISLDRFLTEREVSSLENQLARHARMAALDLPPDPTAMQAAILARGRAAGVRLTVMTRDGTVLADSQHDPTTMENHIDRPEVQEALAGRRGSSVRRSATLGLEMLYVGLPGRPYIVRAALPLSDVRDLLREIRRRVFVATLPAALLALGLALFLSRALTRRFGAMTEFAGRIAHGDFEAYLPVRGSDELADLERRLVALKEELKDQMSVLERDRKRLSSLVDGLPEAVVVLDGDGVLTLANEHAQRLLRLPEGQLLGRPGVEVLREPRVLESLDAFYHPEVSRVSEPFRISWPEPPCELRILFERLLDEGGRAGLLMVMRDITRQVHLERVRTDFVANLSHELRTPLTAIRGAAETLLDAALSSPEVARRFLETIRRHSFRLESLLSDVSDLARIEAGADLFEPRAFDAGEPARQVVGLFTAEAENKGIELQTEIPDEPLALRSDPDKVESALVNLVQNAVRYTPQGGRVQIAVSAHRKGALYVVEDTGIGIPPRDLPRVTERFYRVDAGRSRAQGGTGLGLSIVKHQVETLGGDLSIQSEPGKGTRVELYIPNRG